MSVRLPDWEDRLSAYLADRNERSTFGFDNRVNPDHDDCCTFSGGAVKAITGTDPMAEFRRHYTTKRGAWEALRRYGAGTLVRTLNGKFKRVHQSAAHRGDLVMVDGRIGVCVGAEAVQIGRQGEREGLVRFPRSDWSRAWAVGRG